MKFSFWTELTMYLFFASLNLANYAYATDQSLKLAARVNGEPILQSEFDVRFNFELNNDAQQGEKITLYDKMKAFDEVLKTLINDELLYQESIKQGFVVDKETVTEEVSKIKARLQNEDEFEKALEARNLTVAGLTNQIKRELLIRKLTNKVVGERKPITDDETKEYYDRNPKFFIKPEVVKISVIMEMQRQKIFSIQQKIKNGEKFDSFAQDWGYIARGKHLKAIEDVAFSIPVGDISGIIDSPVNNKNGNPSSFYIIKVKDKKEAHKLSYQEVKDDLKKYLEQKIPQDKIDNFLASLRGKGKIEVYINKKTYLNISRKAEVLG